MYAIRSYYEPDDVPRRLDGVERDDGELELRITSYNVCYTKLLRPYTFKPLTGSDLYQPTKDRELGSIENSNFTAGEAIGKVLRNNFV